MKKLLLFLLLPFLSLGQAITPNLIDEFGQIVVSGSNSTQTVLQAGVNPASYKGMTIAGTDLYDWANLQYAMYLEQQTGKPVNLFGTFKGVNKMIDLGKYNTRLVVNGNFAVIQTTGGAAFSVLGRPQPTDMGDANVMIAALYDISNLEIKCSINQTGIEPGPTYGSRFTGIIVSGAGNAIWLKFNLDAVLKSCFATSCKRGFVLDILTTPGATSTNSQCNGSTVNNCRVYAGSGFTCDVAFANYGSGGVGFYDCIAEGNKIKRGIEINSFGNTTTKRNYINNFHWETVAGTLPAGQGEAAIYLRMGGGVMEIGNLKNDYASVMIDAGTQGGWMTIDLYNVSYWKAPSDGKYFYYEPPTQGGITWKIRNFDRPTSAILNGFAGKSVTQGCSVESDANKVCIE
jgi:hypothetical protein